MITEKFIKSKWLLSLILVIVAIIATHLIIANKIGNTLKAELGNTRVSDPDIGINLFTGKIFSNTGAIKVKNEHGLSYSSITYDHLCIDGISYWDYLVNNEIVVDHVVIVNPSAQYKSFRDSGIPGDTSTSQGQNIWIKVLKIENAETIVIDEQRDSIAQYIKGAYVEVHDLKIDKSKNRDMPTFDIFSCTADSLFTKAGKYEYLSLGGLDMTLTEIEATSLRFYTKYNKKTLSKILPYERDHYELTAARIKLEELNLEEMMRTKSIQIGKASIESPFFRVMRDKLVANKPYSTPTPLYSKMIRDGKTKFNVDLLTITNGYIQYTEKSKIENDGGHLTFSNLNSTIRHLGNQSQYPIEVNVDARFMNDSPLHVDWVLNANDPSDAFTFDAKFGKLEANAINEFVGPNGNLNLNGQLFDTEIHIAGDNQAATCDLNLSYKNLKVKILKDNSEVKKLLSKIVNFVIKGKSNGKITNATCSTTYERDKDSSFWNYIWKSIRKSLLSCLT